MITVKIDDKEYTLEEARKLYDELHSLFGGPAVVPPSVVPLVPMWDRGSPIGPVWRFDPNSSPMAMDCSFVIRAVTEADAFNSLSAHGWNGHVHPLC